MTEDSLCTPNIKKYLVDMNLAYWIDLDKTKIRYRDDTKKDDIIHAIENMDKVEGKNVEYENHAVTYLL